MRVYHKISKEPLCALFAESSLVATTLEIFGVLATIMEEPGAPDIGPAYNAVIKNLAKYRYMHRIEQRDFIMRYPLHTLPDHFFREFEIQAEVVLAAHEFLTLLRGNFGTAKVQDRLWDFVAAVGRNNSNNTFIEHIKVSAPTLGEGACFFLEISDDIEIRLNIAGLEFMRKYLFS